MAEDRSPLVVYSHGNGGLRYVSSFLAGTWPRTASWWWHRITPATLLIDAFAGTSDDRDQVAMDRPLDVSATIDAVLAGGPGFEEVAAQTDPDSVGVIGHSFGGFTALAVAGGLGDTPPDQRVDAIVRLRGGYAGSATTCCRP
ncbi:MAG: hypothetical protein R2716_08240 [Microthrixaceae bacterium]